MRNLKHFVKRKELPRRIAFDSIRSEMLCRKSPLTWNGFFFHAWTRPLHRASMWKEKKWTENQTPLELI